MHGSVASQSTSINRVACKETSKLKRVPTAMTIAGSDSGGGAGIQADLKTFAAHGVYGTCAVTAITAQNTLHVTSVHETPPDVVSAQIEAIVSDIGVDVTKTGMLASHSIIHAVATCIRGYHLSPLVVDPVMVSKGGESLLREDSVAALIKHLIPLATVVTPNAPEAEAITHLPVTSATQAKEAAKAIADMGVQWVLIKGGHFSSAAVDTLYNGKEFYEFTHERIHTNSTHGTGCTLASAIAAGLANGLAVPDAVDNAKQYVTTAIKKAFKLGQGHGPLNHFYSQWQDR